MAPSVAETVTTTVDHASNGIAKLNLKQEKPIESTKKDVSSKYFLKLYFS
jgi:sulfonate dioxygenase